MTRTLLEQISDKKHLEDSWRKLNKTNKKSAGISHITIEDFEKNLQINIEDISNQLEVNTFTFGKVKGATIKKKDGKHRPLRIPEIQDRIVHKAIALKLEELLTDEYQLNNPYSFAYQKGKNIAQAILKMKEYYQAGYNIILEADIVKFFDNVDTDALLSEIKTKLPDSSIDSLLDEALNQEIGNISELQNKNVYEQYFENSENGIPQGNSLSPLLANIYLSEFDQRAHREGLKLIRYADDFIIFCKDKQEAYKAWEIAKEELEVKKSLAIYPLKTKANEGEKISRIIDPRNRIFSFLSIRFDGDRCWVEETKFNSFILKIKALCSKPELIKDYPKETIGLLQAMTKLKNLLQGWVAAYHFADIEIQVAEIDKIINIELYRLFKSFNFTLDKKHLDRVKLRKKSNKPIGLKNHQRKDSGIPFCTDILQNVRKASKETRVTVSPADNQKDNFQAVLESR